MTDHATWDLTENDELRAVGRPMPRRGNVAFNLPTLLAGLLVATPLLCYLGAHIVGASFLGSAGVDPVDAANNAPASASGIYLVGGLFWDGVVGLVGALVGGIVGLVSGVFGSVVVSKLVAGELEQPPEHQ